MSYTSQVPADLSAMLADYQNLIYFRFRKAIKHLPDPAVDLEDLLHDLIVKVLREGPGQFLDLLIQLDRLGSRRGLGSRGRLRWRGRLDDRGRRLDGTRWEDRGGRALRAAQDRQAEDQDRNRPRHVRST